MAHRVCCISYAAWLGEILDYCIGSEQLVIDLELTYLQNYFMCLHPRVKTEQLNLQYQKHTVQRVS